MSDFLFAHPSIASGIGSVIDIFGISNGIYNTSKTDDEADRRAFQADTEALRKDWDTVYIPFKNELK